ncbi:MAG: hypothetical protein LBK72_00320 [Bifidobacteriaceae bacterium]|jgi:hypothetical protein|nr:hypothetical protein [Bifidobacteriaceae bacterium]
MGEGAHARSGTGTAGDAGGARAADATETSASAEPAGRQAGGIGQDRKPVLLRLDPAVHEAVATWARDDLRSVNAQIEYLLRRELAAAGRTPHTARPLPRRGRPPKSGTG